MKIDVLVAEIGSTTTVVNAFSGINTLNPNFIGQGQSPTSVLEGDVRIGLYGAIEDLRLKLRVEKIEYDKMLATSSAAGGLKMSVHGLVYDMTAKAAKEAALGAGAIIHKITAGKLRRTDIKEIENIKPNIILIAGGVDFGERDTALYNAELICKMDLKVPVIYAGNIENREEIKLIFEELGVKLYIVDNVYPKIDELNIEPTRAIIQSAFEEHIIHAPGMQYVRDLVNGPIIPTPGAVMECTKMLYDELGDLIVFDVGGATTDLHSVTEGSEKINRILISPEPTAKRTVEGDLGVYVNMKNIVRIIGEDNLAKDLKLDINNLINNHMPIPKTKEQIQFVERLTKEAVLIAIKRHSGAIKNSYGNGGMTTVAEGKDLTEVKYIIGTGGALTRLPNREEILKCIPDSDKSGKLLYPTKEAQILIDNDYIMASLGVLSKIHKEAALILAKKSLNLEVI